MSMQLHHLHTDGPKPLYKKITADEYERMTARIAELERMDTEHTLQIAKMNGYIHHLEEVLRWRNRCRLRRRMNNEPKQRKQRSNKNGTFGSMDVNRGGTAFLQRERIRGMASNRLAVALVVLLPFYLGMGNCGCVVRGLQVVSTQHKKAA